MIVIFSQFGVNMPKKQWRRERDGWVQRDLTWYMSNMKRTIICDDVPSIVDLGAFADVW